MSWHYLLAQEAEFWEDTCLAGAPSALLSLMPTPAASSSPDSGTDVCPGSRSGTTSGHSTDDHGVATSTSCPGDSLAKTFHAPVEAQELVANDPAFGEKWRELSMKYDLQSSGWKTHQCLFPEDLPWSLVTLPRWGMMQGGALWERTMQEPLTSGIGAGYWPTPTANEDAAGTPKGNMQRMLGNHPDIRGSTPEEWKRGTLNPDWVEWLMGWPIGWTDLGALEMDRFQQWCDSHGVC